MFERTVTYPAAYTHKEASGDPEILIALSWLTRQEPVGRRILVPLAPLMTTFEHSEVIRTYGSGLILSSAKNFKSGRPSWQAGPALALWPRTSMTDLLDQHRGTSALAIVPWGLKEIDVWIRARRTFRTNGDPLRPDILDIWRTQANSTAPK